MKPKEFYDLVKKCRNESLSYLQDHDPIHIQQYWFYAHQIDAEIERVEKILETKNNQH